jgi:hypothetical protein
MTNKMKALLLMTMGTALLSSSAADLPSYPTASAGEQKQRRKRIIPKGCKIWYFDKEGHLTTPYLAGPENIIFQCIALTIESAIRKFKNRHKS